MKTLLAAAVIATFALLPAQAAAQNYEQIIADQHAAGQNPRGQQRPDADRAAESIYGEARGEESGSEYGDGASAGQDENADKSYDQIAVGEDGPQDIYSYISGQEDRKNPGARRGKDAEKAHGEALKARAAAIGKMKQNSSRLIQQQKERAWRLAHPGEEYPGEGGEDGEAGYSEDGGGGGEEAGDDKEDKEMSDAGSGQDDAGGGDSGGEGSY